MSDISKVDKNFSVKNTFNKPDLKLYDVRLEPFVVYGLQYENGKFRRMPEEVAKSVSEGMYLLHSNTAGGRVRFKTDSAYVSVHAKMPQICRVSHFSLTGTASFDLYERVDGEERYRKTFVPPYDMRDGYESLNECGKGGMREYTLYFPLYSDVSEVYIGLQENATVEAPSPYRLDVPIVYYGSSITQGGCASRAGMCYENIISRRLHVDHHNLGFSGNAKAEEEMIDYINSLKMSVFVYDYDHNADSPEYLAATHEKMFKAVRAAHPTLPIVMMSSPQFYVDEYWKKRREIIEATYKNAKAAGDENVYYIPGYKLMALAKDEGTVDGCHPTDLGFVSMAKAVGDLLEKMISTL